MICRNCNQQNNDDLIFCTNCGTQLNDQNTNTDKKKKAKTKKWKIILIVLFILIICRFIVGITISLVLMSNINDYNEETTTSTAQQVNFDLSQYDDYGELSCNRIWVERTTSSYDQAANREFAYFDIEENKLSVLLGKNR